MHGLSQLFTAMVLLTLQRGVAQTPPQPTLQLVPATSSISAQTSLTLYVTIANPSAVHLANPRLNIRSDAFELTAVDGLGKDVPAYSAVVTELRLRPKEKVFGSHAVIVQLVYEWTENGNVRLSAAAATTSIAIKQPFEDEAKGLPGGTAALLYLLLPVIPAFLAYQLVEQRRIHSPAQVPVFRAEHIPFAFFVAVIMGVARLMIDGQQPEYLGEPRGLFSIIMWSALLGALLPALRWLRQTIQMRRWQLDPHDDLETYVRKVLRGPRRSDAHIWVSGTVAGREWAGLRLLQPDGRVALGARLQVSPAPADRDAAARVWKVLLAEGIEADGRVLNAGRVLRMIRARTVKLGYLKKVTTRGEQQDTPVVIAGLEKLEEQSSVEEPLIIPVR